LLTYSGHGGQVPDTNNDEVDRVDETWCLYDRQFLDDELYYFLSKFKEGVRILVFIDCCHSGTVIRSINTNNKIDTLNSNVDSKGNRYKFVPRFYYQKHLKNIERFIIIFN
jgi:metacaspase-1